LEELQNSAALLRLELVVAGAAANTALEKIGSGGEKAAKGLKRTSEEMEAIASNAAKLRDMDPFFGGAYETTRTAMGENRENAERWNDSMREWDEIAGVDIPGSSQKAAQAIRILTRAEQQAVDEAKVLFAQTQDIMSRGMTDAAHSILAIWSDTRRDLADIFKQMADDFFRLFFNKIIQSFAHKAAGSLLNFIFPGAGTVLNTILPSDAFGGASYGKRAPGAGLSTGAGGTVVVNINGTILGEEQHVRKIVIPAIERAAELGRSRIQVRGL